MHDIFEIGTQLIDILKIVHKSNRTFNDLKPENIMITPAKEGGSLKVHLIDFGFVDKFVDETTKKHIEDGELVDIFRGNLLYSSLNQMNFLRTSPKDDIISVFYIVLMSLSSKFIQLNKIQKDIKDINEQFNYVRTRKEEMGISKMAVDLYDTDFSELYGQDWKKICAYLLVLGKDIE